MKYPKPYIHSQTGYYYFTYTDHEKKRRVKSTGMKDEAEAWAFTINFIKNMHLTANTLGSYIKPFYIPGICPIMQTRGVGIEHAKNQRRRIEKYILVDPIVNKNVNDITRSDIIDFCSRMINKTGPKNAEKIYKTLRAVMTAAEFRHDIKFNPCRGIGKDFFYRHLEGGEKNKEVGIFTSAEIEMIFSKEYTFFDKTVHRISFLIANEAGLRRSEILALQWGDIDFEEGVVNVTRAWKSWSKRILGPPKWGKERIVPLTIKLDKELQEYRKSVCTNLWG